MNAPTPAEPVRSGDLRDPLVDPLAADGDAVQLDDASLFPGDDAFGDGWQKGKGKQAGGAPSSIQVKANWKGMDAG